MMSPRTRGILLTGVLVLVGVGLLLLFPSGVAFAEMAAREIRYFWWLILLIALALWFIWGLGRKPRE